MLADNYSHDEPGRRCAAKPKGAKALPSSTAPARLDNMAQQSGTQEEPVTVDDDEENDFFADDADDAPSIFHQAPGLGSVTVGILRLRARLVVLVSIRPAIWKR